MEPREVDSMGDARNSTWDDRVETHKTGHSLKALINAFTRALVFVACTAAPQRLPA
jgi:hypothetical protein